MAERTGVTAKLLPKLRKSAVASAFLDGVSAAAVALMAVVGWQFARAAIVNMPAIVLMVFGAVLVSRRTDVLRPTTNLQPPRG
jgi:chromate transporter